MRSKKDKTAKPKAPSAKPSQTIKKRGRPALSPEEKATRAAERAKLNGSADKASKTDKGPKTVKADAVAQVRELKAVASLKAVPKLRKAKAVKLSKWEETLSKLTQLQVMGAVHVKLDGLEVAFDVNRTFPAMPFDNSRDELDFPVNSQESNVRQMAKVADHDNPDQYAEQQDRWVNHEPLPRI